MKQSNRDYASVSSFPLTYASISASESCLCALCHQSCKNRFTEGKIREKYHPILFCIATNCELEKYKNAFHRIPGRRYDGRKVPGTHTLKGIQMMTWGRSNHAFKHSLLVTCLTACEGTSTQSMSPTEMDAGQNTAVGGSTSRAAGQAVADDTTIAGTDTRSKHGRYYGRTRRRSE